MTYVILPAGAVASMNYLYKHLFDNPANTYTDTPKMSPIGTEISEIKELSAIMGVEPKIASIYALQDPNSSPELKSQARDVLNPGIFVASEDAYLPVVHKAYGILSDPQLVEEKRIRMVRTVSGVRRFKQKRGSIIVNDGEPALDALTALPNDVPGYEKVGSKDGGVYYVGKEDGKWVVRDPQTEQVVISSDQEEEVYRQLNKAVGGSSTAATAGKDKTPGERILGRTATSATRRVDEVEASRDQKLTTEQAHEVNKLSSEELDLYQRLRQRGIDYDTAITIAKRLKPAKRTSKKKA